MSHTGHRNPSLNPCDSHLLWLEFLNNLSIHNMQVFYQHCQKSQTSAQNITYRVKSTLMRLVQNISFTICPPVWKIIHSLKLVHYLLVQAYTPLYNYYVSFLRNIEYFHSKLQPKYGIPGIYSGLNNSGKSYLKVHVRFTKSRAYYAL